MRSKGKDMAVTLSGEGSNQDFDSDQECKFMAFTTTVVDEAIDVKSQISVKTLELVQTPN